MSLRVVFVVTAALSCLLIAPAGQLSASAHYFQSALDPVDADSAGGELPVRAAAASYKGTSDDAWVLLAIELDARALRLHDSNARHTGRLEVAYVATDAEGRARSGTIYDGLLTLNEEAYARASRYGLRIAGWIDLPGGPHELRVSARTARTKGSVVRRVHVPEFDTPLSMSTVSVGVPAAHAVTIVADEAGPIAVPVPTVRRTFEAGERLVLFTEVYESAQRLRHGPRRGRASEPGYFELGDHTTHVVTELVSMDDVILMTRAGRRHMDAPQVAGRHVFSTSLPLTGVPPGDYRIRVRARVNIGPADTAMEEIAISIR